MKMTTQTRRPRTLAALSSAPATCPATSPRAQRHALERATVPLLALVLFFAATVAWAESIKVNSTAWGNDGDGMTCTLWEAIKTAKADGNPNIFPPSTEAGFGGCPWNGEATVELQAGTTYPTRNQLPKITNVVTDLDGVVTNLGTGVRIEGNGAILEPEESASDHRFFNIGGTATLKLVDIELSGGRAARGGAIWVGQNATLDGVRLRLEGNQATVAGGAIYSRGSVELLYATVEGNSANSNGGGVAAEKGRLDILASTFAANGTSSKGGAIVAWPGLDQLTVRNSTFFANVAHQGGAIYRAGLPASSPDTVTQVTFKANREHAGGDGGTLYLAEPVDITITKSALWENDANSTLCAGDLDGLTSGGHNASTDASCGLDHADDHSGVPFTLSNLVDHGGFTEVLVPRCDDDPVGYDCSILIDQYECTGAETDQRVVQRDLGGRHLGDMEGLCDIGSYESICHTSLINPNPGEGTARFTTLLYTDQMKSDGNVLNNGACAGIGEQWQFPEDTSNCTVNWQIYWGSSQPLDFVAIWFLDPSEPCDYDCFEDPEMCTSECTLDPNNWKAPLPSLGFNVPGWTTPPDNTFISLVSPACEVPKVRYVMEFANGVVDHWDPEVQITSGDTSGSGGGQGASD